MTQITRFTSKKTFSIFTVQCMRPFGLVLTMLMLSFMPFDMVNAQDCTAGTTVLQPNGSTTINGIKVTTTSSNVILYTFPEYITCGGTLTMPTNSLHFGKVNVAATFTVTFSVPVNDIIFLLGGAGKEIYNLSVNAGTASIISTTNCETTISGTTITSGVGPASNSGGIFQLHSTSKYTSFTITGPGPESPFGHGGALFAFCNSSIGAQSTLSHSVSPIMIPAGGTATYTFSIDNTVAGNLAQTGISFTDSLPSGLKIADVPNVQITGGSGTITATPGGNSVAVSEFSIAAGAVASIKVDVTNVPGQFNNSCDSNPVAFTNNSANIVELSSNLKNDLGNACLVVSCGANAGVITIKP